MTYKKFNRVIIFLILAVFDLASVGLSFWAAYHVRFYTALIPVTKGIPPWYFYRYTTFFSIPIFFVIFLNQGLYKNYFMDALDELIRSFKAVSIGMIFAVLGVVALRQYEFSRVTFALAWLFSIVSLFVWRQIFKSLARFFLRKIYGLERVLVVGKDLSVIKPLMSVQEHIETLYLPAASSSQKESPEESIGEIKRVAFSKKVSQIILLEGAGLSKNDIISLYDWCELNKIDLKIVPDLVQMCLGEILIDDSLGLPMLRLKPVNLSGFNFYFKRLVDVILSAIFVSLSWPILAVVMILIKMDSAGPVFYHHKRVGYRGKEFSFYKFRSMVQNADDFLEDLKSKNDRKGPAFKMVNDPRITKFGRFIRRYSIDELPQVFNVLKGDMSLVGPRPQVLWEAAHYDDWARRRLRVLPGITGLWQVSGRASLSYEEMIELDIYYIENWTLGLDIKILFKTFFAVLSRQGAY